MRSASNTRPRHVFHTALLSTGWLTIARVTGDLGGILLFIAISRNLGLESLGQYSFAFAIAALVGALVGLGLDEFGLREYSRLGQPERRALLPSIFGAQLTLLGVVAVLALAYWSIADVPATTGLVVLLVTIHVLTFQMSIMFFIPAFSKQRMLAPAIAELVCRFGSMLVAVGLVTLGGASLTVAVLPLAVGTSVLLVVAAESCRRHNGEIAVRLDGTQLRAIATTAWPVAGSTVVYATYNRAAVVMLNAMRGPAETGLYATAQKLYEFGLMPVYLLGIAVSPALSRSHGVSSVEFASTADKFVRTSLAFGAVLAWGLVFVAPGLLPIVLGAEFAAAAAATRLMAAVALLASLDLACMRVILAMHLQHSRLKIQAVAVALLLGLNALLIPSLGLAGAILSVMAAQFVMISGYFRHFSRHEGTRRLFATVQRFGAIATIVVVATTAGFLLGLPHWLLAVGSLALLAGLVLYTRFVPLPASMTGRASVDAGGRGQ